MKFPFARKETAVDAQSEAALAEIIEQQDSLATVSQSIDESVEAVRIGRNAVTDRFYRRGGLGRPNQSDRPLDMVRSGRERVIQRVNQIDIGADASDFQSGSSLAELSHQLGDRLTDICSNVPDDRAGRLALAAEVQAVIQSYLNAVKRTLNPLRFNR